MSKRERKLSTFTTIFHSIIIKKEEKTLMPGIEPGDLLVLIVGLVVLMGEVCL